MLFLQEKKKDKGTKLAERVIGLTVLLPGVSIAIIIEVISNAYLSTIDPFLTTIFSVGDGHSVDFIGLQEVQSPPWIFISLCVAAGSLFPFAITISINGSFRDIIVKHRRLSHLSTFSNISI